jgi:tripartite-type tricarboxylate transporter receptor subunit TctC
MQGQGVSISRRWLLGALALSTSLSARLVEAETVAARFPMRPVTLIVPFSAGGPLDVLGRLLADKFQLRSGRAAIVENKTGGAGNVGIMAVRNAPADGSTLLLIPAGNLTINPTLMPSLQFDVERDFAPVCLLASAPNIIVVSPKLGVSSIAQLIQKAKAEKLNYGSPGVGSQLHLAMELFNSKAGINIQHIPYRGSPQALDDLLGNNIDVLASNLPAVLPAIKERLVVALAMTTADRSPLVPDVPTLAEAGVPGIDVTSWYGMLAPRATPDEVRDAIFEVTRDILNDSELQGKLAAQGLTVTIEPPDKFAERIRNETALWAEVIKTHKITLQ